MSLGTMGYTNIGRATGARVYGTESMNEVVGQGIITANIGFDISEGRKRQPTDNASQLGTFRTNEELVAVPNDAMFFRKGSRGKTGCASGIDGFVSFNGLHIDDVNNDDDLRKLYPYLGINQGSTQLDENVAVTRSGLATMVAGSVTRFNDSKYTFTPGQAVRVVRPSIDPIKRAQQLAARRAPNHPDAPPASKLSCFMEPFDADLIVNWFRSTGDDIFADLASNSTRYRVPEVQHEMDVFGKSKLPDRDLVNVMRKQRDAAAFWSAVTAAVRYGIVTPTCFNEYVTAAGYVITPLNLASSPADLDAHSKLIEQISLDDPHKKIMVFDVATGRHVIHELTAAEQLARRRAFDQFAQQLGVAYGLAADETNGHLIEDPDLLETTMLPILGFASSDPTYVDAARQTVDSTLIPDRRSKQDLHTIQRNAFGSVSEQIQKALRSAEEDHVRAVAAIYDYFSTDIMGNASNHSRPGGPLHLYT